MCSVWWCVGVVVGVVVKEFVEALDKVIGENLQPRRRRVLLASHALW
jgi:hypothetical protein